MNDVYAKSQHAGEAAVENARRDESKAPVEEYKFPPELTAHFAAIKEWCDANKPEVHLLAILGHRHLVGGKNKIEVCNFGAGSDNMLAKLYEIMGDELSRKMLGSVLRTVLEEIEAGPGSK